jgi:hypothetical protein
MTLTSWGGFLPIETASMRMTNLLGPQLLAQASARASKKGTPLTEKRRRWLQGRTLWDRP